MSEPAAAEPMRLVRDGAVGEQREVLFRGDRAVAIRILRDSDAGRRARWGEAYAARVRSVDARRRGAFLDLGLSGEQGFLPLDARGQARRGAGPARPVRDGEAVTVSVVREAARGKSPVLTLLDEPAAQAPAFLGAHDSNRAIAEAAPADPATRAEIEAAIEDALSPLAPLPGGGVLRIEPTAALVAIDVDAGARQGQRDPERFALELNIAAAKEVARQVRLRSLGGIIAVDFVSMRTQGARKTLEAAVKEAFAADPWGVQAAPLSRFGVMELSRPQLVTPLHELFRDADGRPNVEACGLKLLREIEREARVARGREVIATASPEVAAWLDGGAIPWREALSQRAGPRWRIQAEAGRARDAFDVRAV
jgi:Ribonuclease G/E